MEFMCEWCKSKTKISLIKKGEKATFPEIEYCPVCGLSEEMVIDVGRKDG